MTPDVVVDIGNTRMKWGLCAGDRVAEMASLPLADTASWAEQRDIWGLSTPLRWVVASVNPTATLRFQDWVTGSGDEFRHIPGQQAIPLSVAVEEPARVGIDRLLNALAAHRIAHPHPAIVISVGTAATLDLVDTTGTFQGGVILPGPRLMAESLHAHTAKLPLVDAAILPTATAPGKNTEQAILAGIRAAIVGAAMLLVNHYQEMCESPWVFVTGGAAGDLGQLDFGPRFQGTRTISALTLEGIRIAAEGLP